MDFGRGWGGGGRGAPALSDVAISQHCHFSNYKYESDFSLLLNISLMMPGVGLQQVFVKLLADPLLQQELRRSLDRECDVLFSAISRQLSPRCCVWTNKTQLYWPTSGLLITLQWGIVQGVKCQRPLGVTACDKGDTRVARRCQVRAVPPFSTGTWSWALQSISTVQRCQMVLGGDWGLSPSLHPAELAWCDNATGAVTGQGASTQSCPGRSRLQPEYLSLGAMLPLSPGVWHFGTHRATGCAWKCGFETGIFARIPSIQSSAYGGTRISNSLQSFFLIFTFHKS